jgi:hypothetical protein
MNKIIIIEGTDNSGKDTLIKNLISHYKDNNFIEVKHFCKPKSHSVIDAAAEQNESFISTANMINEVDNRFIIFNRAWYGEYIYGTLYRGRTKEDVLKNILEVEEILKTDNNDISFILLYGEPEFLEKNDDGQSLSEGKKEIIEEEGQLFKEIFEKSTLEKKKLIEVTKNHQFISQEEILQNVLNTVEQ